MYLNKSPRNLSRGTRLNILIVSICLLFSIYAIRLYQLQIVSGNAYNTRAEETRQRSEVLSAQRGTIYDRHYDVPLATNRAAFAVDIIPADIPDGEHVRVFNQLATVLDIDLDQIKQTIPPDMFDDYRRIELTSGLKLEQIIYLAERNREFPGVYSRGKPIRQYTQKEKMAHVLGYVGDITARELQVLFNQGYNANAIVGKTGIELQYDAQLRGKDGERITSVDVRGKNAQEVRFIPPEPGNNLVLTIDQHIQGLAFEALGERIGSVVVIKPATGEILAMVSYPSYNPNRFYDQHDPQAYRSISLEANFPFVNRAISSNVAPASTFKVLMTTAVIEEKVFGLSKTVLANGSYRLGNRVFHDWRREGFGRLNIFEGLALSSNVFFWTMGVEYLGIERIIDYCYQFGFGAATGIDLPGELPGLVPTPEWKQKVYSEPWVTGDTANISIGQGFLTVSPLQLANMVALVVNDGIIYKPYLLKEVRDHVTGEVIARVEPEILHKTDVKPSTFQNVRRAMRGVITDGTAKSVITSPAVAIAGKTGTGQVARSEGLHSWFVAYAPYDAIDPQDMVIISILVDAANEWEWWAPKAANIILHGIFTGFNFEESIASLRNAPRPLWYL